MTMINLDDPLVWVHACAQRVALFKRVMLMALENLAIA